MPSLHRTITFPYTIVPSEPTVAFPQRMTAARPQVQTFLEYGEHKLPFRFPSLLDSGADYCVFPAQFGEMIGVPIRTGKVQTTAGIGDDTAYFHAVKVFVEINKNDVTDAPPGTATM